MTPILLPITLTTASVLALLGLILASRVGQGRFKHSVPMGDGGNADMIVRMRTHANFTEYVPFLLVLMGLLELGGGNRTILMWGGAALVFLRIFHAIGMPRPAPNIFRAVGALGTFVLMAAAAIYGLVLVLP